MKLRKIALALSMLGATQCALAANLFTITGTVAGGVPETRTYGYQSAEQVFAAPKFENLHREFASYSGTEAATLNVDFRGLPMTVAYPNAGDPTLTFEVPSLHISQVFHGHTREESQQLFSDFMKREGGAILNQIMKKLAAESPYDPIAGNPNSLMSKMVASDFAIGFGNPTPAGATPDGDNTSNLIGIGARLSTLRQNGITNSSFTLPFSYTIRSDIDPRRQLVFNLPVSYSDIEGAKAYAVGLGAAYRLPMSDEWTLTPAISYGAAGSRDMASYGQAVSVSLTSAYAFEGDGYDVVVGNMVGFYKSLKLSASGYSYHADIQNTVLRNGVMLSHPANLFGRKLAVEYSLIDTRFFGTDLYMEQYNELGVTLGTNRHASIARSYYRAGLTLLHGRNTNGFTLNFGYWF